MFAVNLENEVSDATLTRRGAIAGADEQRQFVYGSVRDVVEHPMVNRPAPAA